MQSRCKNIFILFHRGEEKKNKKKSSGKNWTQLNKNNENSRNRARLMFIFFITRKLMFLQPKRERKGIFACFKH